jgi:hypothetical protein
MWVVSLRFGINSIFLGLSLVMFGLGLKQASEAQAAHPLQPFPLERPTNMPSKHSKESHHE